MEKVNTNLVLAEYQKMETERLVLRPVGLEDTEDMFEYASDEETVEYVFPIHKSLNESRENIANYFLASPLGKYAILIKETNKMVGTIDIRVDSENHKGEIGYIINKKFWGQGYVPEAARQLLWLGFEKLRLIKIEAMHDEKNPKSGRVMEKVGMKREGFVSFARYHKNKPINDVLFGITINEYQESQGK